VTWQQSGDSVSAYVPNATVPLTTKGDILGYDTAADRIPVGSNGDVLTADSTQALGVKWAAPSGGGGALVLLEEHTASNSAELDFTSWYSSSYDDYLIEFVSVIPATNDVQVTLQMSTNGGSSYDTGSNYSWGLFLFAIGGSGIVGSNSDTSITVGHGIYTTGSQWAFAGSIHLNDPANAAIYKFLHGTIFGLESSNFPSGSRVEGATFAGAYLVVTAVNAFRVICSSGNIASGTVRIYGLSH
jgi:hypothetical protein